MAKKKKVASPEEPSESLSFEQSLAELQSIVGKLEGGQLPLADSLKQYEQGVRHLQSCYQMLAGAEQKIELLSGVDAEGKPVGRPFDDPGDTDLEEKGSARSRRRTSRPRKATGGVDDSSTLF